MRRSPAFHETLVLAAAFVGFLSLAPAASAATAISFPPALRAPADCNGDGAFDVRDVLRAGQFAVGLRTLTAVDTDACDVLVDGTVDSLDTLALARIAAGLQAAPAEMAISVAPADKTAPYVGVVQVGFRLASVTQPFAQVSLEYNLDGDRQVYQPATIAAITDGNIKSRNTASDVPVSPIGDRIVFLYWDPAADLGTRFLTNQFPADLRLVVNDSSNSVSTSPTAIGTFGPFALGAARPEVKLVSPAPASVVEADTTIDFELDNPGAHAGEIVIEASLDGGRTYLYSTEPQAGQLIMTELSGAFGSNLSGALKSGNYVFHWDTKHDLGTGGTAIPLNLRITVNYQFEVTELQGGTALSLVERTEQLEVFVSSGQFYFDPPR